MTRKVLIMSVALYLLAIAGGAVSPRIENWWHNRNVDPGQLEVRKLSDLYEAEQYDQALAEATKVKDDREFANYRPQILYVQWVTDRKLQKDKEAKAVQVEFLRTYPDNPLAADMHFADAMELLASGDYSATDKELASIEQRFPNAPVTSKAREIRKRLAKALPSATRPGASASLSKRNGGTG